MKKVMIMSLGGSPEPLKKSIAKHQPEILIFFASHDSILKSGEVLQGAGFKPNKIESEITENPNSLYECYKAARLCVDRASRLGVPDEDILVDYTGGTKVMSAALLLATAGRAYGFNYVGGDTRSKDGIDWIKYARSLEERLSRDYQIVDAANKRFSLVVELKSASYPRALKIEIRKEVKAVKTETSIAYSPHANIQVMLKTVALEDMMKSKLAAFLDRREIRDAYDLEFLIKRGVTLPADAKIAGQLLAGLEKLGKKDFSVKLGALLPTDLREYYRENGFRILTSKLETVVNNQHH